MTDFEKEIREMNLEQILAKKAETETEIRSAKSKEELEGKQEQIELINMRIKELQDLETRKDNAKALQDGTAVADKTIEKREDKKMENIKEFRNKEQYINAYAEYVKTGKDEELRALLTTNVGDGTIAVPDFVYDIVKTAWDKNEIMSLVAKAEIKGNLKVNFEISGTDAVVHTEGSGAVAEEELIEGIVTLTPEYIKKWISISDEVMSLRGEAFLRYIYAEIAHKIVKKMADVLVGKIAALPTTATATSPAAAKVATAPALGAIAEGVGTLSDEASNPVVIMNKLTWSEFKKAQYAGNYGVDIFEGLRVLFNNTLPSYASASEGQVYAIVGDLGQGALANFPNGDIVEYVFDTLSRKKEDLVEVLGKEFVGLGVVADKAFANLTKPANA